MRAKVELFDDNSCYSREGRLEEIILEDDETIEDVIKKVVE